MMEIFGQTTPNEVQWRHGHRTMPRVGFERMDPVLQWYKTVHVF